jgi:hypothetical protein
MSVGGLFRPHPRLPRQYIAYTNRPSRALRQRARTRIAQRDEACPKYQHPLGNWDCSAGARRGPVTRPRQTSSAQPWCRFRRLRRQGLRCPPPATSSNRRSRSTPVRAGLTCRALPGLLGPREIAGEPRPRLRTCRSTLAREGPPSANSVPRGPPPSASNRSPRPFDPSSCPARVARHTRDHYALPPGRLEVYPGRPAPGCLVLRLRLRDIRLARAGLCSAGSRLDNASNSSREAVAGG